MGTRPTDVFEAPSFLFGPADLVGRKAKREGARCARHYLKDGRFPAPRELLQVPPDGLVILKDIVDFQRERSAWRLYAVLDVLEGLWRALEWKNGSAVGDLYEATFRETIWGSLFYAVTSYMAPTNAENIARRLEAVLRFWDSFQPARYLYTTMDRLLSFDELMVAACGCYATAWCPEEEGSIERRLQVAAERMARATREDCIEAIVRQLPHALAIERGLQHRDVLSDPVRWRERVASLDPMLFDRTSAASMGEVLGRLVDWDKQLSMH